MTETPGRNLASSWQHSHQMDIITHIFCIICHKSIASSLQLRPFVQDVVFTVEDVLTLRILHPYPEGLAGPSRSEYSDTLGG